MAVWPSSIVLFEGRKKERSLAGEKSAKQSTKRSIIIVRGEVGCKARREGPSEKCDGIDSLYMGKMTFSNNLETVSRNNVVPRLMYSRTCSLPALLCTIIMILLLYLLRTHTHGEKLFLKCCIKLWALHTYFSE